MKWVLNAIDKGKYLYKNFCRMSSVKKVFKNLHSYVTSMLCFLCCLCSAGILPKLNIEHKINGKSNAQCLQWLYFHCSFFSLFWLCLKFTCKILSILASPLLTIVFVYNFECHTLFTSYRKKGQREQKREEKMEGGSGMIKGEGIW